MNELALFNNLFDGFDEDGLLMPSFSLKKAFNLPKTDVKEDEKFAQVIVPDDQLSLAIGKSGQNARLAAKLTNWKIDIKSESQFREMIKQLQQENIEETTEEEQKQEVSVEETQEVNKEEKTEKPKKTRKSKKSEEVQE